MIGENDEPIESDTGDDLDNFWQTSVGKFKFSVDDLPQPLQYIYQILKVGAVKLVETNSYAINFSGDSQSR